jgi:hypothetical protein
MHRSQINMALPLLAAVVLSVTLGCAAAPAAPASWPPVPGDESDELPPIARLVLPDGVAVAGELGTFAYRDSYADSPWLAAAGLETARVGAGQQLTAALPSGNRFGDWSVSYAAAHDVGAELIMPLAGVGGGQPVAQVAFDAPPPGEWVVQLFLVFPDDDGDATYYWRLNVD